jgi:preprotein translocase subunit SecG
LLVYVLYGLFILACVVLVIAVLLQPGKADAGALFSSSVSSTAFGPRGTQTLLAKITIGAAALFMLVALILSMPALSGQRSVIQTSPDEGGATPQATPAATPAASPQASAAPSAAANTGADNANTNANPASTPAASPAASR